MLNRNGNLIDLLFQMIAFLLISIGSTVGALYAGFDLFMEEHFFSPSALLIAIGIILLLVSIFGCVGAIKESVCLVKLVSKLLIMTKIFVFLFNLSYILVRFLSGFDINIGNISCYCRLCNEE